MVLTLQNGALLVVFLTSGHNSKLANSGLVTVLFPVDQQA